jgi:hypothetical protein
LAQTGRPARATDGSAPTTLQVGLEDDDVAGPARARAAPPISDPVALFSHLDASGRFHRDGRLGRIYHRGMVSFRENVRVNSLHLVVHGNRVKAHVDRISPLAVRPDGPSGYSAAQAVQHNLAGMAQDLVRLLRGRQGDHRCELDCSWDVTRPLDPAPSACGVLLEARVAGSLDEARLRAAVRSALGDRAAQRDHLDVVSCRSASDVEQARERLYSAAVPMSTPPLHISLVRHPAGDVLMLNLNHAATDGVGALRVLRCIAGHYAGDGERAGLDFLAMSDLPVVPSPTPVSALTRARRRAVQRTRDVLARPTSVAADCGADRAGHGSRRLCVAAGALGRTDVLVAALHLAISDWNLQHATPSHRISVLTQADLRPPEWDARMIGNFSVTARMSTRRRDRATPAAAMTAIAAQAARNTSARTGVALIAALERAGLLALWAKQSVVVLRPLTTNDHVDSTMLCNLGRVDPPSFGPEAGDTVELWCSSPARAPATLCIGAATIGDRLHVTVRHPHRLFDAPAADRFAECYRAHLQSMSDLQPRAYEAGV